MEPKVSVGGTFSGTINFAMQQNYVPIIRNLVVSNVTNGELKNLKLKISFEPQFAKDYEIKIDRIAPEESVEISPIKIIISPDYLLSLTEKIVGNIHVEVCLGEESIYVHDDVIELLAYDEWAGLLIMPEIISAFVTPNHPKVIEIISKASVYMEKWTGNPSFTGYQTKNPNNVKKQMAAIYAALQEENIAYNMPPASYERIGQRVRLPNVVLEQKTGTCLDLSVLYSSCLEAVGLHALLIFIKGHAFAGCWLEEDTFSECSQEDVSAITKRLAVGIEEISVIECTDYVAGKNVSFDRAENHGNNHLSDPHDFQIAIDIIRSRGSGIRPIPMRAVEEGHYKAVNYGKRSIEEITQEPKSMNLSYRGVVAEATEVTKQKLWERKLLDLSLRNTLLSFRVTKNSVQLMTANLAMLEDELARGEDFRILSKPSDWNDTLRDTKIFEIENEKDFIETVAQAEFKSRRIRTFLDDYELEKSMKSIHRQAKLSLEENGVNTLYLALGFLRWFESDLSEKPRYAPIVLIPVDIVRKIQDRSYIIRIRDEEPQMNITLLEMLRQDFGIHIAGLDPLPMDESGINLMLVYNTIRQGIMTKNRWDVEEFSFIGLFSFSQFIMWNDIRNRADDLLKNKVVSSLISGKLEWMPHTNLLAANDLDANLSPMEMAIPTSVDSTQLVAIYAAAKGQSFVLHGPPGTGKSQTITNMIANALFQGKSVLFVAEKMAALTVVQKRLAAIGLAPFCLELHSNKAQKKSVLDQLDQTLQVGQIKKPEEYEETANELHELRSTLNSVIEEIHKKRKFGMTLYEAISKYENAIHYAGSVKFSKETILKLKGNAYLEWRELLIRCKVAALEFGGIRKTPFQLFENRTYSMELRNLIKELLNDYKEVLERLQSVSDEFASYFELKHNFSNEGLNELYRLCLILSEAENLLEVALNCKELNLLDDSIRELINNGLSKIKIETLIEKEFDLAVLQYDIQTAVLKWRQSECKWVLPKLLNQNKLLKDIRLYAKNPKTINKSTIIEIYQNLLTYHKNCTAINSANTTVIHLFGSIWNNGNPNWEILNKAYLDTYHLYETIKGLSKREEERNKLLAKVTSCGYYLNEFKKEYKDKIADFNNILNNLNRIENDLVEKYLIHVEKLHSNTEWLSEAQSIVKRWIDNIENLKSWTTFLQVYDKAVAAGLSEILSVYRMGTITEEELIPSYECNIAYAIINQIMEDNNILQDFQGMQFEKTIAKYKNVLNEFEVLTIKELVSKLSAKIPNNTSNTANSSELGILQKAIRSGGRMMSIRKLFDSIPTLLRRISPCMLMSPISVAQYIDPSYPKFDLVIFDEASQLPTCEAVGTIARGENVIVVGDPKQLPPTSFFSSNHVDEENYDKEDLESLLDDCLALSMPQEHLLWHYRSRHESLIAYSNLKYYDNKLFTFPSPNDLKSEVQWIPIDGYYDKGNTKQNVAEAKAVVNEILIRLKDEELRKESIGVVTFSSVQQILIDDILMEEFRKNPELEKINNECPEPIFIKNLENVQGDERDVILFSIGYGPDKEGKVSMNFGPLNREGGWRRLNVAITRARKRMLVYSTIKPEQIDLSRTRSEGVAGLRGFLEFAARGKNTLTVKNGSQSEKYMDIETVIAKRIQDIGFEVKCNIGYSEYKIDIGVVNPNNPEEYILGIMCDGEKYRLANTARDRNVLQPSVLEGLGWNIFNVWILDWLDSPEKVLDKIKIAIEKALLDEDKYPVTKVISNSRRKVEFERVSYDDVNNMASEYQSVYMSIQGAQESFYEPMSSRQIANCIKDIIEREAPISKNLLYRKVLSAWMITRLGNKVELVLDNAIKSLQIKTTISYGTVFYWRDDQNPEEYKEYRFAQNENEKRSMDDICAQEVSNAIRAVIESQISLLRTDMIRETAKLFGFTRLGSIISESVERGILEAQKRQFIQVLDEGNRITVNELS